LARNPDPVEAVVEEDSDTVLARAGREHADPVVIRIQLGVDRAALSPEQRENLRDRERRFFDELERHIRGARAANKRKIGAMLSLRLRDWSPSEISKMRPMYEAAD
jgi:hypothetical protein